MTSFAQEIKYDKIENGERSIMCVYKKIRSLRDRTVFSIALMAEQDKEKKCFLLSFFKGNLRHTYHGKKRRYTIDQTQR